jgi:glycosidase
MKKILIYSALILSLVGCQNGSHIAGKIAASQPIMPIRMTGDTAHVVLTDYVPVLYGDTSLWDGLKWTAGEALECLNITGTPQVVRELDIVNRDRSIHAITMYDQSGSFAIPVLPAKPVRQAFISLGYEDGKLRVGFCDSVVNPSFEAYVQNTLIDHTLWQEENGSWILDISKFKIQNSKLSGRTYLRIFAEDETYLYNDLLLPMQDGKIVTDASELNRHDQEAQVLYSLMIDRFVNGNPSNDWKMNSPEVLDIVDYQGGDLAGITQKIEEGYFDYLGVNTLWISPITQNPWDAWGCYPFKNGNKYDPTKTYTKFSGYHGYWPIYATSLDKRFGTNAELRTLLSTAHAHGINVVLDYVANHMHINSPTLQEHPDWHTDSILPDGRRNFELWDEARLTTWFDKHIPTLDLEREEVCEAMTDSALYWLENFELDGYRHDACKHIPEGYWRMLGQKIATRFPGRPIWMIGETYGSPELIGGYVKSGMLNSQFDFNVYFTAREALMGLKGLDEVMDNVLTSLATYGSHHTMGNISGNHDQIRFASIAGGAIDIHSQGKEEGWTQEIGIGDAETAYRRSLMLETLNMTLPGVPCIYQGDEYAEVGGNDPDNRHMMRFDNLSEDELQVREQIASFARGRRRSMALLYGDFIPVVSEPDLIVFKRIYLGELVTVTIDRKKLSWDIVNSKL